ncbi:MAG: hypothetical protein IJC38_00305 [Erysipelotrichaceae bacterium]|nr:hypothetical protein [Erysipelotrichaceae bacterium]
MKKLLIKLFAIAMVFSLSPIDVHAVETENDTNPIQVLYVGDVDAIEIPSGDGWTFDAEEGVLTLNNANIKGSTIHNHYDYNYDAAIYVEGDLTIELIGDNYVERQVTTAPTSDSMYYAICSAVYPYEGYDEPSKLKIVGSGKLTAGVEFVEEATEWEYLYYSCGIFSNSYGGVDLTGLQKGSELYVYGGFDGEADYYQVAGAWNTSPRFGDNQIVIAYMDIEGTMENEAGYNWNNNDACLMKVLVTDAYLNSYGLLTLNDNGSASGNGWTWNNNVLTLSENCGVNAVWFKSSLNSSKLFLNGDVTLNSVGVPNGYDYADSIYTQTPLEIDTGEYTLTLTSERYGIYAENDVLISGGTVSVEDYEEDYNDMYAIYAKGADVTIQNATLNADNELYLEERYIEESDSIVNPGLLKIENSVFNSILGISSWGSVKIDSSDVTISNCFIGISADGDMELTNSTINITADLYSDSMVFNSGGSGIVVIDNCNLNVTALGDVLYMYTRNMTPDFTRVSITNTAITTPEVWSVGTQLRGSSDYITLLDTDGNVVKTLIGTASLVPHEHTFGEWKDAEDGLTHVRECECEETETEEHAYDDGEITVPATHTAKGEMTYTCTGCGYSYTEDIPATPEHTFGEWIKISENVYERECNGCGYKEAISIREDKPVNTTTSSSNAANTSLNNSDMELIDSVLTEEEQSSVAAGEEVMVYLTASDISDSVSNEDQEAAASVLGNAHVGMYLDIDLFKIIGSKEKEQVTETSGEISITVNVPDALINKNAAVNRTYKMIRVHWEGGSPIADIIQGIFDPIKHTFSFMTNRFSTYVLVYEDTVAAVPTPTPEIIENSQLVQSQVPNTSDHHSIFLWIIWMMISGLGVVILYEKRIVSK